MANTTVNEESAVRIARTQEVLEELLEYWPGLTSRLQEKGKVAHQTLSLRSIASNSLFLGQAEYVTRSDTAAAARYFAIPLGPKAEPGFRATAKMLEEGVGGLRPWDGEKLTPGNQIERIVCYVLLGKLDELVNEYASLEDSPELFSTTPTRSLPVRYLPGSWCMQHRGK